MLKDKSQRSWFSADDKTVVQAMLRDPDSRHWRECLHSVTKHVRERAKAQGISEEHWDDIVQEVMIQVCRYLPFFRVESTLKTWIFTIIGNCIINFHRKSKYLKQQLPLRDEMHNDDDQEGDGIVLAAFMTTEEAFLIKEQLFNAFKSLNEYLDTHNNSERNLRILELFLFKCSSLEEIAHVVGCSAPVVGYVVRSAQRYVRDKLRNQS